jgi:hypothetical protein
MPIWTCSKTPLPHSSGHRARGIALVVTVVDLTEDPEVTFGGLDVWLAQANDILAAESLAVPESHHRGLAPAQRLGWR